MSLITPAEARTYIPALTGTGDDAKLQILIDQVESEFAALCAYPVSDTAGTRTMASAAYTLVLDGPGERDLDLSVGPVTAISSIYDDPTGDFTNAAYLVASADYFRPESAQGSRVVRCYSAGAHGAWGSVPGCILATFTAGFTTAPARLKMLISQAVHHKLDAGSTQNLAQASRSGDGESFRGDEYPAPILRGLGEFMLPRGVA